MKQKLIGIGIVAALGLCVAQADTLLYSATGALVSAFGADGKAASFGLDAAQNVSNSSTNQPVAAAPGGQALLSVPVVPQTNPASTGITAKANLSGLGGSPTTAMNDAGIGGDAVAGDGIYSVTATVAAGTPLGTQLIEVTFTDSEGRTWTDMISMDIQAASEPSNSSDIPTLPEWGMILLAALLLLLAARNLPRHTVSFVTAASLLLAICVPDLKAELPYPVWENVPMDSSTMPPLAGNETPPPPEEPPGGGFSAMSLTVPQSLDAEILALASALGTGSATGGENAEAKAVRLFNWVRNNIDYQQYYGLRKGAALTLLEGTGNDFDQSILLADLLVAAGYPASDVKLRLRGHRVDYSNLMSWMGLAQEPYPGKTFQQAFGVTITQAFPNGQDEGVGDLVAKQAVFAAQFSGNRGARWPGGNGAAVWFPDFPEKANLLFNRMFVQLTVGGVTYDLDPSYKVYEKIVSSNDLLAASGYSRSAFLTAAGGSGDANSTSGLSQTNIGTHLAARTAQLLTQLNGAWANLTLAELVNGRRIVRQDITSLSEAFALPKVFYDTGTTFNSTSDAALASYKTTVRFQTPGLDYTIPTSDLKGRKITLTFSGNTVDLRLDDAAPVATTTVTGTSLSLTITVTHPGSVGAKSETKTYRKNDAFAYAILYGFTPSGRMLQKRYEQLRTYLDEGKPDTSREVRTELLNIMGLSWLYQTELCSQLIAQKNNVLSLAHHRFGRMAQEEGFYVDVGLQLSGSYPDSASPTDSTASARFDNVFHLGSVFASAMEHGIIEQMQPGSSAVSTVNILRKANSTAGNALYLARSSNWSTVSPILTAGGYSTAQVSEFNTLIGQGAQLFLPKNVGVTQGNWTGSGWIIRSSTQAGMIINGGYSGGYSTAPAPVVSPPIRTSYTSSPAATYSAPSAPVYTPAPAPSVPRYYASDPVDMGTGAFVYSSDDMATGVEGEPRGLRFSRYYSGNEAARDSQNLGFGWSHNLHIRAEARSAAESLMGEGTPQTTAPFLASMLAAADLYRSDATPKEWGVATLAVGWLVDGMKNNAVAVRVGKDTFQFIGQSDGTTYMPPAGSTLSLTKAVDGTYRLQERLGNIVHFNADGKATKIVDVDAKEMAFVYNANGTLNYVEDCYARRFTFTYSGTHITGVTDSTSPARSVGFGYDANWNLTSATDPELKTSWFDYVVAGDPGNTLATEHRIVRLRNHDLETITQNVWDSLGRVERQFLHGDTNKTFHLYYTGRDNFEVNPQGGTTHYFYDTRGRSTGRKDADGNTSSTGYDGQDRVVSRTSATGEVTGYAWDAANNLRRIDYPRGGGSAYMDYDSLNRLDLVTDPNTVQTKYQYFGSGNDAGKDRPQFVKAAFGTADESVTEYTYFPSGSAIGRVQTIKDGDNLTTQKTYDAYGQPDATTLPGNYTINEDYSARGNLDAITDPNLKKTSYTYNKRRQVTNEVADQTGIAAATDTVFDNQARVSTVTPPADNAGQRPQELRTYNPTDKVRLQKLNGVTVADTAYDSRDWENTVKDAVNRTTTILHKANGAVKEDQRPGSRTTKFFYDGDNRVSLSSNPGSNSGTRNEGFVYDTTAGGLPRTVKTEADGKTVTSEFDRKGQLRFLKDRKNATFEFRYDALGRQTHVITPQNMATITTYKKNGRPATVSEPSGDSATLNYNATTGRLSSVVYSGAGGGTVNYTSFDSNGNVTALNENGANGISRAYDGLNRVTSYTFAGQTIGYRYYPSGKLANLIYPGGSENGVGHVEYTYNADGRLYQVIDKLDSTSSPRTTTYAWYSDGRLQSISRPNGTTRTISYDPTTGRQSGIAESAGLNWTMGYWSSDDIKTLDLTPAIPANQLSAVPNASMTFDSANQLATFNGQTVTHDLDGNMLTGPKPDGGTALYSYDSRNRLTGMGTTAYTYNAENNRIGITSPSETTTLLVDPEGALPKVLSRTKNGVTTRYVYGVGLQYEVSSAGVATYYHYDQTGNTAALTNQTGNIIERVSYSPYGTIRYRQSNFDTPFLYNGLFGVMSDSNGLINMRARYYNPATMRFINSDSTRAGLNWYAYANNPIMYVDPSGRVTWGEAGGIALNFGAGVVVGAAITAVVVVAAPVIVSAGTAALVAAGVSAASAATISVTVVTLGVGGTAVIGSVSVGTNTYHAAVAGNWNAVAFNAGTVVGGLAVGAGGGGRALAEGMMGKPSPAPNTWNPIEVLKYEQSAGYKNDYPGGSLLKWIASAPTPASGGASAAFTAAAVSSIYQPAPTQPALQSSLNISPTSSSRK